MSKFENQTLPAILNPETDLSTLDFDRQLEFLIAVFETYNFEIKKIPSLLSLADAILYTYDNTETQGDHVRQTYLEKLQEFAITLFFERDITNTQVKNWHDAFIAFENRCNMSKITTQEMSPVRLAERGDDHTAQVIDEITEWIEAIAIRYNNATQYLSIHDLHQDADVRELVSIITSYGNLTQRQKILYLGMIHPQFATSYEAEMPQNKHSEEL
jgi:hypothetical protein